MTLIYPLCYKSEMLLDLSTSPKKDIAKTCRLFMFRVLSMTVKILYLK